MSTHLCLSLSMVSRLFSWPYSIFLLSGCFIERSMARKHEEARPCFPILVALLYTCTELVHALGMLMCGRLPSFFFFFKIPDVVVHSCSPLTRIFVPLCASEFLKSFAIYLLIPYRFSSRLLPSLLDSCKPPCFDFYDLFCWDHSPYTFNCLMSMIWFRLNEYCQCMKLCEHIRSLGFLGKKVTPDYDRALLQLWPYSCVYLDSLMGYTLLSLRLARPFFPQIS